MLEVAAHALGPLPVDYEVYAIGLPASGDAVDPRLPCWACFEWIEPEQAVREVRIRKKGTLFAGRVRRWVHVACLRAAWSELRKSTTAVVV